MVCIKYEVKCRRPEVQRGGEGVVELNSICTKTRGRERVAAGWRPGRAGCCAGQCASRHPLASPSIPWSRTPSLVVQSLHSTRPPLLSIHSYAPRIPQRAPLRPFHHACAVALSPLPRAPSPPTLPLPRCHFYHSRSCLLRPATASFPCCCHPLPSFPIPLPLLQPPPATAAPCYSPLTTRSGLYESRAWLTWRLTKADTADRYGTCTSLGLVN